MGKKCVQKFKPHIRVKETQESLVHCAEFSAPIFVFLFTLQELRGCLRFVPRPKSLRFALLSWVFAVKVLDFFCDCLFFLRLHLIFMHIAGGNTLLCRTFLLFACSLGFVHSTCIDA